MRSPKTNLKHIIHIIAMLLLRLYDCISLLTTDDSLHQWLANFAVHRPPAKRKENSLGVSGNLISESLKLLNSKGWKREKVTGQDIIESITIQKIGKVFKYEGIINSRIEKVKKMLFDDFQHSPDWSPTIQEVKVIKKIDSSTFITYTVTKRYHCLSSRDFVHLRGQGQVNDQRVLTCVSVVCPEVPENSNIIRAEHRLFSYIIRPVPNEPSKTHFIWLMNVNLKGWLPQALVDQTVSMGMVDHVRDIRKILQN